MPLYTGPVNTEVREQILKYGATLPQETARYTAKYYEGKYFNIDLKSVVIEASNDAEAMVVLYDFLNKTLVTPYASDQYDSIDDRTDEDEDDEEDKDKDEDDEEFIMDAVERMFDNDTLWLVKQRKNSKPRKNRCDSCGHKLEKEPVVLRFEVA